MRDDIVAELKLTNPVVLWARSTGRPRLRVRPAHRPLVQVLAASRATATSGIIYCIRRSEVEELTAALTRRGLKAVRYHAGLSTRSARQQDAFVKSGGHRGRDGRVRHGIDRSNVRYLIHAGMPKSLEHYQQEAGRAGRDGLEAECLLLHSGGDYGMWKSVLGDPPPPGALRKLGEMYAFCQDAICRHRALVTYFGQSYDAANCRACDVCLGETVQGGDTAGSRRRSRRRRRAPGRFGGPTGRLLGGAQTGRIAHSATAALRYGSLRGEKKSQVRAWIDSHGPGPPRALRGPYPTRRSPRAAPRAARRAYAA